MLSRAGAVAYIGFVDAHFAPFDIFRALGGLVSNKTAYWYMTTGGCNLGHEFTQALADYV